MTSLKSFFSGSNELLIFTKKEFLMAGMCGEGKKYLILNLHNIGLIVKDYLQGYSD